MLYSNIIQVWIFLSKSKRPETIHKLIIIQIIQKDIAVEEINKNIILDKDSNQGQNEQSN